MPFMTHVERYWAKVTKGGADECWPWTAGTNVNGYGVLQVEGQSRIATHIALEIDGRARPGRMMALHSCDSPACCNPRHLRWGDHKDNCRDMFERNRQANLTGERHGNAKLTEEIVRQILSERGSIRAVAREFGLAPATVAHLRQGRSWRHIERPLQVGFLRGSDTPAAKLDESVVRKIRNSPLKQRELAAMYGVTQTTISDIVRRKNWKHVP